MITFSKLGYVGRFGNQMFQYAGLVGIADKVGCRYGIDYQNAVVTNPVPQTKTGPIKSKKLELLEAFDLSAEDISGQARVENTYEPRWFHFDPAAFNLKPNTDIFGFFQTEKYFQHCANKIRSEFTFKAHISAEAQKQIEQIRDDKALVSLHVRRTDYIPRPDYFPPCTPNYYQKAMSLFENAKFVVFSDDITWCQENLVGENIVYITGNNQFVDMCMMSMCDHHIIANSSFSWWGAWLNKSSEKKVIAPRRWFGIAFDFNSKDLYCDGWIVIGSWYDSLEYYWILWLSRLGIKKIVYSLILKKRYFTKYPDRLILSFQEKLLNVFRH